MFSIWYNLNRLKTTDKVMRDNILNRPFCMYGKIKYKYRYIVFFSCIKYARASVSISKMNSKYCSYFELNHNSFVLKKPNEMYWYQTIKATAWNLYLYIYCIKTNSHLHKVDLFRTVSSILINKIFFICSFPAITVRFSLHWQLIKNEHCCA